MSEYELIKTENRESTQRIVQYNSILYTASAALLLFALERTNFVLCLTPYIVIVPLFLLNESTRKAICVGAAYLYVFLEGQEYHWEGRHHKFDKTKKERSIKWYTDIIIRRLHYYSLNLICSLASIYKIVCNSETVSIKLWQFAFVLVVTVVASTIMAINTTDYVTERDKAIKQWQAIKAEEEAQKRKNNNRNPQ
ncbi:MAG: hypothetical protein IJK52_12325 [Oscillospiraceae bacterium]|nr:hypothetical protein [Oscillospiraceae bacterium]